MTGVTDGIYNLGESPSVVTVTGTRTRAKP
jgi:hypothetical protein